MMGANDLRARAKAILAQQREQAGASVATAEPIAPMVQIAADDGSAPPAMPGVFAEQQKFGLRDQLDMLLPSVGRYAMFLGTSQQNFFFGAKEQLAQAIEGRRLEPRVYMALASYGELEKRTQANAAQLACLYLDIDCGPDKQAKDPHKDKTYPTQKEGLAALLGFVKATGLKVSLLVNSGAGWHVYFKLDRDYPAGAVKAVAERLKALCARMGLRIDPAVTADTARVLRPIGSLHHHDEGGSAVRAHAAKVTSVVYTLGDLDTRITGLLGDTGQPPPGMSDMLSINRDVLTYPARNATMQKIAEHCAAIAQVRDTLGVVPEPRWRGFLGVTKHCTDGEVAAHQWSEGYNGYDYNETERKRDNWKAGPTTCDYFADQCSACASCQHRGKITSPIALGHETPAEARAAGNPAPPAPTRQQLQLHLPDWRVGVEGDKVGSPLNTTANIAGLVKFKGYSLRYNQMARMSDLVIPGLTAATDDLANTGLARLGDDVVRLGMKRDGLPQLVAAVASENPYHPVKEWIDTTPWDRSSRRQAFHDSLELRDPSQAPLRDQLMDAWVLQGIGALESPTGVAAQGVLVLAGPQGVNKTRWAESLHTIEGAVRTGLHLDPTDRDSVFQATSAHIVELGEFDHTFRRSDVSALKAFITRSQDILRRPYAIMDSTYPRRTIFVGTVNGSGFYADDTGSRRFWTVNVRRCHPLPRDMVQQLWAEYRYLYDQGQRWYLDDATRQALNEANEEHQVIEPDWTKRTDTVWMSATDVCRGKLLLSNPTRSEATKVAGIVRSLNGNMDRRSNGARLLAVPGTRGVTP